MTLNEHKPSLNTSQVKGMENYLFYTFISLCHITFRMKREIISSHSMLAETVPGLVLHWETMYKDNGK